MKITRHPFCVAKGEPQWPTSFLIEKHVDLVIEREQGMILTMVELANFDVWNLHKGSTILEFMFLDRGIGEVICEFICRLVFKCIGKSHD